MQSFIFILATAVLAVASPSPSPQGFDVSLLDSLPTPANTTVPSNLTAQVVDYDSDAATDAAADTVSDSQATVDLSQSVADVANITSTSTSGTQKRSTSACAAQPVGYGPVSSPDTVAAFQANSAYSSSAASAPVPSGYYQSFTNLNASNNAYGYLGYTALKTYDSALCAAKCNAINACASFNIYFERDPSLDPGTTCTNPASTTLIKCVFWGGPVNKANAVNSGQWRSKFQVVIAGSNGYVNKTIAPAAGYSLSDYYGNAAMDAPNDCNGASTLIATKIFTGSPFDASLCSALCDAQTASGGKACQYFNTFLFLRNGVALGQYCRIYSRAWQPSYADYTGTVSGGYTYTVDHSYGFSSLAYSGPAITGLLL